MGSRRINVLAANGIEKFYTSLADFFCAFLIQFAAHAATLHCTYGSD